MRLGLAPMITRLIGRQAMRASVVKIGNYQGIRIPKPILEQTGIKEDVELEVDKNQIINPETQLEVISVLQ